MQIERGGGGGVVKNRAKKKGLGGLYKKTFTMKKNF